MSDDTSKTGPQDAQRVNIHEDYEVRDWCQHFRCTKEPLVAAVEKVGLGEARRA
jgi:hypothetical protein